MFRFIIVFVGIASLLTFTLVYGRYVYRREIDRRQFINKMSNDLVEQSEVLLSTDDVLHFLQSEERARIEKYISTHKKGKE